MTLKNYLYDIETKKAMDMYIHGYTFNKFTYCKREK